MQTQTQTQPISASARGRGRPVNRQFATVTLNGRFSKDVDGATFRRQVKAACGWRAMSVTDATTDANGTRTVRVEFGTVDSANAVLANIKARFSRATLVLDS